MPTWTRARRLTTVAAGAAVVLAVGIVTAGALTAPDALASPDPSPTVTSSTAPPPATTPTATATPTAAAETPSPAAVIGHGSEVWGAYVAVVDSFESPEADAADARITELGYTPGGGEIGCDQGAAEALGLPEDVLVVTTYFTTEQEAAAFAQQYGPDMLGVAKVTLYCMD